MFEAAQIHGKVAKVRYRPAWLARVIQSHFAIHGEEIYKRAKSVRNLADQAVTFAGKLTIQPASSVATLTAAARLIKACPKRAGKAAAKDQASLF